MAIQVGMVSLGCPKNQMDAEMMLAALQNAGMEITAESGLADVVIVNTCGFIEDAKKESIENILEFAQLKKEGRIQKIIVTGCMAQRYREEVAAELPECDAVLGLGANGDIVEAVKTVMAGETMYRFPAVVGRWTVNACKRLPTFSPICASATAVTTAVPTARFRRFAADCAAVPWRISWRRPKSSRQTV